MMLLKCLAADLQKTKHLPFWIAHLGIPVCTALVFLLYYAGSPWSAQSKMEGFYQVLGMGFPVLIGLFTVMLAQQEGPSFQTKMLIELASETDLMHVRLQEVSLPEFVQEIQKTARGLCTSRKIHLHWAFRSEVQHFHGDAGLLHRAFSNVFSNAVENSSEDGTIAVEIFDEEGYLTVSVQDQGRGFSSQAIKYATTPFYMEDASRNSKSHFGIGLYFADMVIRLHAGQLILENVEEGGGAKVTMKIPNE